MEYIVHLFPQGDAFDVERIRYELLLNSAARPDPRDSRDVVVAENSAEADRAVEYLSRTPPQNPWKVLIVLRPDEISIDLNARRAALHYFEPIFKNAILPYVSRFEDEDGRPLPTSPERDIISLLFH